LVAYAVQDSSFTLVDSFKNKTNLNFFWLLGQLSRPKTKAISPKVRTAADD
jgi:hypothetical protein